MGMVFFLPFVYARAKGGTVLVTIPGLVCSILLTGSDVTTVFYFIGMVLILVVAIIDYMME